MLELQDIGSRQPSMESLTGAGPDGSHLHPGHQYANRRSPSLRFVIRISRKCPFRFIKFFIFDLK